MSTFDDLTDEAFDSVIGRKVVDQRGEDVGTLDGLWTDEDTGKVAFLGVKTGWIFGKTHVVPVHNVQIQEDYVRVPYEAHFVKDAPSYPPDEELSYTQEKEVYDYYGVPAEEATSAETVSTAGTAGAAAGTGAGTSGTERRVEPENSIENPVVERGPAGAREPIGEPTVPGVRSAALPGDRDIAAERRGLTGPPQEGRGAEREPARPPVAAPPAPTVAPGMVIAPEEEQPGTGGRDLGVGRVRLRKVVRSEGTNVPVGAQSETPPPANVPVGVQSETPPPPTSVPVGVQRETPPPAEPVRTGKDLEDTGQAGVIQPTGSTGTGTGAGTSGTGSSGLTGAEPEAERARERLDR